MADRLIRITTTLVVVGVAAVAAIVSYEHAYELVRAHGDDGWTARLVPLTVDGLIYASSMVMLQSARRQAAVPPLALSLLGLDIVATLAVNIMHGLGHGPIGAAVAAWPAVALVGSYELLMTLIRASATVDHALHSAAVPEPVPADDPLEVRAAQTFAEHVADGKVPSIRAIRAALSIGQARAQQVQSYLASVAN